MPEGTSEFEGSASAIAWCARVSGSGLVAMVVQEVFVVLPTVPSALRLFDQTVVVFAVPLKPPVTTAKAVPVVEPGTDTARNPVIAVGSAIVGPQPSVKGEKPAIAIRPSETALLVPPLVTTLTDTVPGTVKPAMLGTMATTPVSDHDEDAGTTSIETVPCVKLTLPGIAWKPLPLISIGKPTGFVGVVSLLMF